MRKKTAMFKQLVFGLFLICAPKIFAQSSTTCCENIKAELEQKIEAFRTLCSSGNNCKGYALRFKGNNTSDYAISKDGRVSSIAAITVCFWVKTRYQATGDPHVISYAVPRDNNHLNMYFNSTQLTFTVMYDYSDSFTKHISRYHDIKINDGKWHHICATWKSSHSGHYEIYKDGKVAGIGSIIGSSGRKLSGGGMWDLWVVGQDQDIVGGGFAAYQAFEGEMTEVNIWDKVLSSKDILKMSKSCQSIRGGNVKSWNDFKSGVKGNVKIVKPTCCSMFYI